MREADYGYEYPIKAKYHGEEINVRIMRKDEMPEDGITYYCALNSMIFTEDEKYFNLLDNKAEY